MARRGSGGIAGGQHDAAFPIAGGTAGWKGSPLPRFLLLYALVYAAYGVEGPFLPALLAERGMSAEAIGLILAAGTAARLLSAPLASSLADRFGAPRLVLAGALLSSALLGCGYALAASFVALLLVSIVVSVTLAPINPMADALASAAARDGERRGRGFSYGLIRGIGSAAFVAGATIAGPIVAGGGLVMVVWVNAALLAIAAFAVMGLPRPGSARPVPAARAAGATPAPGALRDLLAMPLFRRLLLVTGLVQGSHALYGGFATLRWQEAGIAPEMIGLLWSVAVASEVVVFLLIGPRLLARLGPTGLAMLAAAAGVLRWAAMASTAALPVQFLLQPLHGLTFAALHLATMRLLTEATPPHLAVTAFGMHASLGPGLAGVVLMLAAGPLYGSFGAGGFWAMAALCAIALPAAATLVPGEAPARAVARPGAAMPAAAAVPAATTSG